MMSRSRPFLSGGAPGYLDLKAIETYIGLFGDPNDLEEFVRVIFEMDGQYMPIALRKIKAQQRSGQSGSGRGPH